MTEILLLGNRAGPLLPRLSATWLLSSLPGASFLVITTNSCGIFAALVSPSLDRTGVAHDLAGLM